MKKTISKLLLTAGTAAVLLSACSKVPEESKYIPKEAGVIFEINAKQISQKLLTEGLTMDKLMAAAQSKDTADAMSKSWKDAQNSGIDLTSNFFASVIVRGTINDNKSYAEITASLKDAGKFESFLKTNLKSYNVKAGKDFKYTWDDKSNGLITWNDKTLIYLVNLNTNKLNNLPGANGLPSPDGEENAADSAKPAATANVTADVPAEAAALITEADHIYHLKENETAGTLEPFKKLLKEKADMGMFINTEAIYNSGMMTMLPANFKKLMDGSAVTATVDFEKGKISAAVNSYMGKEMLAIYKKYGKREIDMSMLEKYPGGNITGFAAYGFDFHMVGEIIKSVGMDGLVNMGLSQRSGLTMDDLLNAFDGQLVYVASDFAITKKPNPYFEGDSTETPSSKWIFNMKVANKDAFNKIMTSPLFQGMLTKQGDKYVLANPDMAAQFPAMSLTEKSVTLGSDQALLDQYLGGKGKIELPDGIAAKVKGSMFGGWVDLQKVMATIPEDKVDEDEKPMMIRVKSLFKDLTMVAQPVSGDVQTGQVILNFKDESKNSLVQLVELGTEVAKMKQAKDEKRKKDQAAEDSLLQLVPADTQAH
ncbi:DUF4836 family protein [Chitinophaga sp. Cy-1792]|uniref:DUF4836 family protein n=1 Tax=Chitinophaga sp. Cy-1792 TaxID=2608339 RepID=UPI0014244FF4|nr:DUF4836 family protein [Chitinophaga sp. Cy-1792]NIG52342.1 hypothetical protein [Chitinophaga sp. Cy-1792]